MTSRDSLALGPAPRRRPSTIAVWVVVALAALLPLRPVTYAATALAADVLVSPTGEHPQVALRARNRVAVVWNDGVAVRARLFRLGQPRGPAFRVDDVSGAADPHAQVAMNDAGGFVVVWDGGGNRPGIRARLFTAEGRPLGGSFRVSGPGGRDPSHPLVAMGPDGSFAIGWEEANAGPGRLRIATFGPGGAPLGQARSLAARGDVANVLGGIGAGPGFFAAGWTEVATCAGGRETTAAVLLFNGSGQPVGDVARIADKPSCDGEGPAVFALPGGDLGPLAVLAAESGYSIQRFAPDSGEPLGPRRVIASSISLLAAGGDGRGRLAVIREIHLLFGDQQDEFEPLIRLFDSDGRALTDWLFVSGLSSLAHQPAAVALARNGNAVVVWKRVANDPETGILLAALKLP